jgi:hypothetical protein
MLEVLQLPRGKMIAHSISAAVVRLQITLLGPGGPAGPGAPLGP